MRFVPSALRGLLFPVVVSTIVVGLLVYLVFATARQSERLDNARADRDQLAAELDAQEKTSEALARQVEELGGNPIVDPDDASEPVDPDDPDDSTDEISQGDIALAVASWCADTRKCKGEDGDDATPGQVAVAVKSYCSDGECEGQRGSVGPPPSDEAVSNAVESFCADGACRGRPGRDGRDGSDGDDSDVPGPKGDTGSTGRNFAGLTCNADGSWTVHYSNPDGTETILGPCRARDGKDGSDGKDSTVPGPRGEKGEPGRGIQSVTCNADGSWSIAYTDGTSSTTPGPCRAQVAETQPPDTEE